MSNKKHPQATNKHATQALASANVALVSPYFSAVLSPSVVLTLTKML